MGKRPPKLPQVAKRLVDFKFRVKVAVKFCLTSTLEH